ncbi:endo-1,4-beta-xylanase [Hypnocyclicus thermotrophus]|uniref:Beta-xylanase n=1 Tax=Hypnocyclicus thermotrophus TaxID=1627895 RepID=A0AA46I6A0_9FUSO|nr:endo-1,4-beta-xylanase [Hypnocyclicus thermotrophus]TDT71427.1 endo-1,4-beta-xylanase [Hypnocyclicus thermotrophus]
MFKKFFCFIILLVFSNCNKIIDNTEDKSLRKYAKNSNILIGTAIESIQLEDIKFAETLKREFNYITPENSMKWGFIHSKRYEFDFDRADKIVDFALKNNMKVRGHTLIWHIENPEWLLKLENDTSVNFENILAYHIKTVVKHYKGKVYAWDVINEALEYNRYKETFWYKNIGEDYIEKALKWTHKEDPNAKLFINDNMIEEINPKSDFLYELVNNLLSKNVPLDGIGFQFHLKLNNSLDMESVEKNIKRFLELGLEINFTEVDIETEGELTEEKLEKQATIYKKLMILVKKYDKVTAFTTWGLSDKYSWIVREYDNKNPGLIFDEEFNPKLAYYKIKEILQLP